MESTPLELRIAMNVANNQVQAKNMGTIAKDTRRTTEIGTKDATAAMVKEVEAVETTRKAVDLVNKKSCAGNQTKEVMKHFSKQSAKRTPSYLMTRNVRPMIGSAKRG